jgi:arylsulfatase A-like enzyme
MTGKHPARLNITDWIPGGDPQNRKLIGPKDRHQLPLAEVTLAETLRDNGYATFFAGKWHLGGEGYFPEDQGFEINKGGHHRGSPPGGYYAPYNNPKLEDGPKGEYLPDRLTDESIRFVEDAGGRPFFLMLSFYTVHTPIQASKRHLEANKIRVASLEDAGPASVRERNGTTRLRQDNAAYASMVEAMDENVGRLMAALAERELTGRTIVLFTSDNGGLSTLGRGTGPTSNQPLRAGKGWCYEGGIRVPLIVSAPGITTPGSTCRVPVMSVDLYPTVLELVGLPPLPGQHLDGLSLAPLLRGGTRLKRDAVYWHFPHYHGSTWAPGAAIRKGDWKLIEFYEEAACELYHLGENVGETHDLSRVHPDKTEELRDSLRRWQQDIGAQMPRLNPAFAAEPSGKSP